MAITFAVRGQFTAYQSTGSNVGFPSDSASVTSASDAGALSGNSINMSATGNEWVMWPAVGNVSGNRTISMLARYKPNYTGTPASNRPLFQIGLGRGGRGPFFEFWHASGTGKITVNGRETTDNTVFSSAAFGTAFSPTSGTWYDLYFEYDGSLTTNAIQFWVDNSSLGQLNASRTILSSWKSHYWTPITLGATTNITTASNVNWDEIVIWDTLNSGPGSIALVGGTGALNGASRTALVAATNIDESTYTDPGVANVKTGVGYTFQGVSETGTYDGSDRWTDPGQDNVRNGTAYKANSTSNNKTGDLVVPTASQVKTGVTFESNSGTTGTYDGSDRWSDPGISNVRKGIQYQANSLTNNETGTLSLYPTSTISTGIDRVSGKTSNIFQIYISDTSTGMGLTGLVYNSSGLTAYYHRDTDTTATAISLVNMTLGTFTSGGFKEIDATNMPGWYQFCPPDAALASGAKILCIHLKGATNMSESSIEVQLTAYDPDNSVNLGLSNLDTTVSSVPAKTAAGLIPFL